MNAETGTSLVVGALSATGAATAQIVTHHTSLANLPLPIISGVIGAAVAWGMMRVTVQTVERDVGGMRSDIKDIAYNIRDISDRVSRMEGKLEHQGRV